MAVSWTRSHPVTLRPRDALDFQRTQSPLGDPTPAPTSFRPEIQGSCAAADVCNRKIDPRARPRIDSALPASARSRLHTPRVEGSRPRQVTTPRGAINRAHQTRDPVRQANKAPRAPSTLTLSGRPRDVELHPSPVRPEHPLSRPCAKTRLENLRPSRTAARQTRLRVSTSGPPHLLLRDKEQDPPHPGCLPRRQALLQELGRFSTSCPQTVDYLPAPL